MIKKNDITEDEMEVIENVLERTMMLGHVVIEDIATLERMGFDIVSGLCDTLGKSYKEVTSMIMNNSVDYHLFLNSISSSGAMWR